jgi:glycosyltransferase involved in cell wall biosynthesis
MITVNNKGKILIIYNNLFHYRIPIFNILGEKYDLTVAFSFGSYTDQNVNFKIIKLPVLKFSRFVIHKDNIYALCSDYDTVIIYGDIAWLKLSMLSFYKNRKFKIIIWTIGVSASYKKKFDEISRWDVIRDFFYNKADGIIFYTDYPLKKYLMRGFDSNMLFVAPNTVEVYDKDDYVIEKDSIIFIGTLYKQKGIWSLLDSYKISYLRNNKLLPINIIGSGEEYYNIKNWIEENLLTTKIFLLGPIFSPKEKSMYFKRAYACISPTQAGLSVLESMGYGVPFVTMHDAITGGERLNIQNGINGILMEDSSQLQEILIDITENKEKYLKMGKNAFDYYWRSCRPIDMANGIMKAIDYVMTKF